MLDGLKSGFLHIAARLAHRLLVGVLVAASSAPGWCASASNESRPGAEGTPTPVAVFLYLRDIQSIAGAEQLFDADVLLQAEWVDSSLAGRWPGPHRVNLQEVWHPNLTLVNRHGASASFPEVVEVQPSGQVRYRQRYTGHFSVRLDLRDFPLDKQQFHVRVVSMGNTREQVDLVPLSAGKFPHRAEQLSVTDWTMGLANMEAADLEIAPGTKALAGVRLSLEGKRNFAYYGVHVILPLVMIVFMGWTALLLDHTQATTRMAVTNTTMLTLIAYRFALSNQIPHLPYMTRFDYFMTFSTILVFLLLLVIAAGAFLNNKGRGELVLRVDPVLRLGFPLVFICMILLVYLV